jgi:hypothetical protein
MIPKADGFSKSSSGAIRVRTFPEVAQVASDVPESCILIDTLSHKGLQTSGKVIQFPKISVRQGNWRNSDKLFLGGCRL